MSSLPAFSPSLESVQHALNVIIPWPSMVLRTKCLTGWCTDSCLSCTASAQKDLGTCLGFQPKPAQPCLDDTSVGAVAVEKSYADAGSCSADDQTKLSDAKTVGDKENACGKKALGVTGIDHDEFTSCIQSELGISAACSECYYPVAKYGFKNEVLDRLVHGQLPLMHRFRPERSWHMPWFP